MKNTFIFKGMCLGIMLILSVAHGQDSEGKIKSIADDACNCATDISVDLPKDSIVSKINSCITTYIIDDQVMQKMFNVKKVVDSVLTKEVVADTVNVTGNSENYIIVTDKNFKEIQAYLYENCPSVKRLMRTNNDESRYSMSTNKKALKYYKEGQQYDNSGDIDMAIVSYNKAVKADPKFAFAWDNLGINYRKRGNYEQAILCYKKSLEADPYAIAPLMNMGVAYEYLKNYKSAAQTYQKYIELHPDDPEGYYGSGRTFYILGDKEIGLDYIFKAYLMYTEAQSPYVNDAQKFIQVIYNDLDEEGKLEVFMEVAQKNNININKK